MDAAFTRTSMRKFLIVYFVVVIALSLASLSPIVVLVAFIFTLGVLGFPLLAANTILLYSLAFLPVLLAGRRLGPIRSKIALVALAVPAAVAIAPGCLTKLEALEFANPFTRGDFEHPSLGRPTSIEIDSDEWDPPIAHPMCDDNCLRLLFNHEVSRIRIVNLPRPRVGPNGDAVATGPSFATTFSIAKQSSCPEILLPRNIPDQQAVRDRLVTGECLIATQDGQWQPDVKLVQTILYASYFEPTDPRYFPTPNISPPWPLRTNEAQIRRIAVEQQRDDSTRTPIMRKTEVRLETLSTPFYFGYHLPLSGGGNDLGPVLGRKLTTANAIDIREILRHAFGLSISAVKPIGSDDAARMVEQILASPKKETFTSQEQSVIKEAVAKIAQKSELNDADLAFIRRVIGDARINDGQIGISLQTLFRKFPARLQPSIGLVIGRLAIPVPQAIGHYNSILGWSLMVYPAAALKPFREQIMTIVEQQPDWPTTGLLTRVAELGGNPSNLIAQRLNSPSDDVRRAAATAACRATPDVWPAIEPVVIDHLAQPHNSRPVTGENSELLLALIRFGNKAAEEKYLPAITDINKNYVLQRLTSAAPGFPAERCQNFL